MKSISFICLLLSLVCWSPALRGQLSPYQAAMQKGLEKMGGQESGPYQEALNQFQRIAAAEKGDWLSRYYQAYCHMSLAIGAMQNNDMTACGNHVDQAQRVLDQARELSGADQSEIFALQGLIYTGRIWSDPQSKGPEFSPKAAEMFERAKVLNPENPRAYYLQGQLVLFTPAFWGGGPQNAMPLLETALQKFEQQQPASPLHPSWGKNQAEWLLNSAKEQMKNK